MRNHVLNYHSLLFFMLLYAPPLFMKKNEKSYTQNMFKNLHEDENNKHNI